MSATKVVTSKVRFSYVHVFEPQKIDENSKAKYSVSLIIPKTDTKLIKRIEDAIEAALQDGKAKFGGKIPANWKNPLRDGDEERPDDENYTDSMFVNANSDQKPEVVDTNLDPIMSREEFYSGCYGRASVNFYAFNVSGNKGVACGLNNLQKLEDGPRLSGGSSAQEDFGDLPEEDDLLA